MCMIRKMLSSRQRSRSSSFTARPNSLQPRKSRAIFTRDFHARFSRRRMTVFLRAALTIIMETNEIIRQSRTHLQVSLRNVETRGGGLRPPSSIGDRRYNLCRWV